MSWPRPTIAILLALCACESGPSAANPPAAEDTPPKAATTSSGAVPAAATSASAATQVASGSASGASATPSSSPLTQTLAARPQAKMKNAKAYVLEHKARIGVYFGLPDGWRYDDPSWLSITPRDIESGGWFVALRLRDTGLSEANEARLMERGPRATRLGKNTKWDDWQQGVAGRQRWPARIRRGRGEAASGGHGQLEAIAAIVAVPDTPAVGFVASWPASMPDLEATMLDIARHLHRCKIEVGRGCVAEE